MTVICCSDAIWCQMTFIKLQPLSVSLLLMFRQLLLPSSEQLFATRCHHKAGSSCRNVNNELVDKGCDVLNL